MAERITLSKEQMGFGRKTADTVVGGSNIIDGATIIVGLATANPIIAGWGVTSLIVGKEIQNEWVRKRTVNKGAEKDGRYMTLPPRSDVFVPKK